MAINVKVSGNTHTLLESEDLELYDWNEDLRSVSTSTFFSHFYQHVNSNGPTHFKLCAPSSFSPTKAAAWMWGTIWCQSTTEYKVLAIVGADLYIGNITSSSTALTATWRKVTSTAT